VWSTGERSGVAGDAYGWTRSKARDARA